MSLCGTSQLIRFLCRMSDVLVKSTDRCTCTLFFQFLSVVHSCSDFSCMNTDDPHLKCHLMSQVILHICPHHHVVVLNLRCRRSCHNANENLRNNSHFIRKISLEEQEAQKEDRFLRGKQIAYLIYEQFRVTGTHDSVENYTDLFTIVLRNDDIQEFESKWDGILLSMTKIPHDDILEGLYKLRIRV